MDRSRAGMPRAAASIRPTASSATEVVVAPSVRLTRMPSASAASRSTLSRPIPNRTSTFRPLPTRASADASSTPRIAPSHPCSSSRSSPAVSGRSWVG